MIPYGTLISAARRLNLANILQTISRHVFLLNLNIVNLTEPDAFLIMFGKGCTHGVEP